MTGGRSWPAAGAEAAFDAPTRTIHLALAILGIAPVVSGHLADDYRNATHIGFTVHRRMGIGMGAALLARVLWGIAGPRVSRFSKWLPVIRARLSLAFQDIVLLGRLQLPERETHEGLAGLVQTVGLLAFQWMAFGAQRKEALR